MWRQVFSILSPHYFSLTKGVLISIAELFSLYISGQVNNVDV
jgi:hypothetical protein